MTLAWHYAEKYQIKTLTYKPVFYKDNNILMKYEYNCLIFCLKEKYTKLYSKREIGKVTEKLQFNSIFFIDPKCMVQFEIECFSIRFRIACNTKHVRLVIVIGRA